MALQGFPWNPQHGWSTLRFLHLQQALSDARWTVERPQLSSIPHPQNRVPEHPWNSSCSRSNTGAACRSARKRLAPQVFNWPPPVIEQRSWTSPNKREGFIWFYDINWWSSIAMFDYCRGYWKTKSAQHPNSKHQIVLDLSIHWGSCCGTFTSWNDQSVCLYVLGSFT